MSSDGVSDDKVPASNDEEKSSGSGATSEDYEMVKDNSPSPEGESRLVVTDQGSMEESLKEAVLEDTGAKVVPQIDPSVPQPVVQSQRRPLLGPSPG